MNELYSDKQFVTKLLYPNYNIDLILENEDHENLKANNANNLIDNDKPKNNKNCEEKNNPKFLTPSFRTNIKNINKTGGRKLEKLLIDCSRNTNSETKKLDYSLLF